jgi:hypothetical protein
MTHARVTGEIYNRDSPQAQRPGGQQVKTAVPGEIINTGGGFEEYDRCGRRLRVLAGYAPRHRRDFEIIQPADQPAFDALGVKIF